MLSVPQWGRIEVFLDDASAVTITSVIHGVA